MARLLAWSSIWPSSQGSTIAPARIDRRQGNRLLADQVGDAQALERPACDRDVGVRGDPLGVDHRAEPVVAGNVVAPHEGAVGRVAARGGDAPARVQLEPAIALEIGPYPLILDKRRRQARGRSVRAIAIGDETADLEGAERGQLPILGFEHRQHLGIDVRRDRRVAVRPEPEIIRRGELEPVAPVEANIGDEQAAAAALAAVGMGQAWQGDDRHAEQVEARALIGDAVPHRIMDDPHGADLPGRIARATILVDHGAGRVGGPCQCRQAALAARLDRSQPAAILEHEQEVLDDAVAQILLEDDAVAISDVTLGAVDADIALGAHLAADPVPDHPVGAQMIPPCRFIRTSPLAVTVSALSS